MPAPRTSTTLPNGLPPWLVAFVEEALRENLTPRGEWGRAGPTARQALLQKLVGAAEAT